jgi:FixJ family two-component response regulator
MDLRMPELNGIETIVRLHEKATTISARVMPVIMISGYLCPSTLRRAIKQGVVDFFEKPLDKELLLESIQHWIQYDIGAHARWQRHHAMTARLATLSRRERQVLTSMLEGMSNKEIARHLGVSPKAIETYRANLMRKMEARTAASLAVQVAGCLDSSGQPVMCPTCLYRPR